MSDDAVNTLANGFCKEGFAALLLEFTVEARVLLAVKLGGCIR